MTLPEQQSFVAVQAGLINKYRMFYPYFCNLKIVKMKYHLVYDFAKEPRDSSWVLMTLICIVLMILLYYHLKNKKEGSDEDDKRALFLSFFTFIWLLFTVVITGRSINDYDNVKKIYNNKNYAVIEGVVADFDPMPYSGHKHERFRIDHTVFEYSDFDKSYDGFRQTKSHGGPIRGNGQKLLIYYYKNSNNKNCILKIFEIY